VSHPEIRGERPFKCRCGRETHRPEVFRGTLYCPECAFDEEYGTYRPAPNRKNPHEYVSPTFVVRKVG
jgi:hypothetical protein